MIKLKQRFFMEIEKILEDNERFKLLILKHLEIEKGNYTHIATIYQLTGLSKFKLDKLLLELTTELLAFPENPKIIVDNEGLVEVKNLNLNIVKQIRLNYFENSITFQLLKDMLTTQTSLESFSNEYYLSRSQLYVKRKKIKTFFNDFGIKIKKNLFIGDEMTIRNVLFSILYDVHNGMKFPFSEHERSLISISIKHYEHWFNLKMTNVEKVKLRIFIGVAFCRVKRGNLIKTSLLNSQKIYQEPAWQKYIERMNEFTQLKKDYSLNELDYVAIYIFLNMDDSFSSDLAANIEKLPFSEADNFTQEVSNQLFSNLKFNNSMKEKIYDFTRIFKKSNRNRFFFDFAVNSFKSDRSIRFFVETYPYITSLIINAIETNTTKYIDKSNVCRNQLVCDCIFILFSLFPIETLERPVCVCVDFTFGKYYNEFIAKQINGFKHFNLFIVDRLTADTDIYISDCNIDHSTISQIIWKNPPTADDWEDFGNKIVEIKNKYHS